jgi:hypothetical protein
MDYVGLHTGVRGGTVGWGNALQSEKVADSIPDRIIEIWPCGRLSFGFTRPSVAPLKMGLD